MSNNSNGTSGTVTVSFCNQPYPAYLGGYQADMVTRTAMALEDPHSLKRNISNHLPIEANMTVIEQTVRHFNHAILQLMAGNWSSAEGVETERQTVKDLQVDAPATEAMEKKALFANDPLCSVWGDFVLLVGEHYYWGSINKCDHSTTAQMILDAVRIAFAALKLGTETALLKMPVIAKADVDKTRAILKGQAVPQSAPVMAPGGTSKRVDTSHVPTNGDGKRKNEPEPQPEPDITLIPSGQSDSGTPHFLIFPSNKEQKATFGAQYNGQMVSFEMQKVNRVFSQKDGSPEYELYAISSHQFPAIRYIHADPKFIKHDPTLKWFQGIEGEQTGRWRVVCYVNVKGENVYFNVNKVEPIEEDIPPELLDDKPAQPKGKRPEVPAKKEPAPETKEEPIVDVPF